MTQASLSRRLEASRYVAEEQQISGSIAIGEDDFERFKQAIEGVAAPVEYQFKFYRDVEGHAVLKGKCATSVIMICERCLDKVTLAIAGKFQLGLAYSDEQAKHLPKSYEPALMDEKGNLDPWELLEDELILALPMFANHAESECKMTQLQAEPEPEPEVDPGSKKENPFAVLATLKQK